MTAVLRRRSSLRAVVLVVGGLLLVAVAFGAPDRGGEDPFAPDGTGPLGTRGLVLLLEALDSDVELVRGAPPDDAGTALLLQDLLAGDDVDATLDWVRRGGVLLVADDRSPLFAEASDASCPAALAAVEVLEVGDDDAVGRGDGGDASCFDGLIRSAAVGDGTVVALATPLPLTNDLLDEADSAVLAAALLAPAPGGRVAFVIGPSAEAVDDDPPALADLVADRVNQGLLLGVLAVVLWALWRSRSLGRPVAETQPVAVAGSELVVAVGRLLDARRQPAEAADVLRADVRRAVGARLGLAADAEVRTVAAAVAARSTLDQDRAAAALGEQPVTSDDDLLAVAADLDRIRTDVLGSRPS